MVLGFRVWMFKAPVLGFKVSRFLVHSCVTRLCRVSALTLEVLRFSGFKDQPDRVHYSRLECSMCRLQRYELGGWGLCPIYWRCLQLCVG